MAELEKIKKERAEEQERKVRHCFTLSCLQTYYKSELWTKLRLRMSTLISWFMLGTRAKGRGGKDPHRKHLEWKSINQLGRTAAAPDNPGSSFFQG